MREHPILFSGEQVKAILDGRKTQTRRVVKPQPYSLCDGVMYDPACGWLFKGGGILQCPYGVPGDRLWARETWRISTGLQNDHNGLVVYKGNGQKIIYWQDGHRIHNKLGFIEKDSPEALRWRPSIHMPRWASRITLEVTAVRVERLRDISIEDARAEGVEPMGSEGDSWRWRASFHYLWDSINVKRGYSWESNPWVWVVEFEQVNTIGR